MEHKAGRELDKLIHAKVMGKRAWHPDNLIATVLDGITARKTLEQVTGEVNAKFERKFTRERVRQIFNKHKSDVTPHYSTDIAAAWQVIEKMRADGWAVAVFDGAQTYWDCQFYKEIEGQPTYSNIGDTAPLAICLAALKTVEN